LEHEETHFWHLLKAELKATGYFSDDHLALISLNFAKQGLPLHHPERLLNFPPNLFLHGLNSFQIRDVNSAFLKFGIENGDYESFYDRIQNYASCYNDTYMSLLNISKKNFLDFCEFIFAFQRGLIVYKSKFFEVHTLKLRALNGLPVQFYAKRSLQIEKLRQVFAQEGSRPISELASTNKRHWGPLENYMTAYLNLLLGFGNQTQICKHPAWHMTRIKRSIPRFLNDLTNGVVNSVDLTINDAV